MYIEDGTLRSRVAFYNFSEVGKNALNRFVGGFHDIYKESIVPRVQYLDDVYSVAFAQDSISFFSSRDVMSPALLKQVQVTEEIQSVFYSKDYVGVIVAQEGGEYRQRMDVYKPNGDAVFSQEFTYDYTYADIDGDTIFLYNEDSCRVYTFSYSHLTLTTSELVTISEVSVTLKKKKKTEKEQQLEKNHGRILTHQYK